MTRRANVWRRHLPWPWDLDIWTEKKALSLSVLVMGMPGIAGADPLWDFFEARCLVPYEHLSLPDTRGLTAGGDGVWAGGAYPLLLTEDSCTARGVVAGELETLLSGRQAYEEVSPGVWHSSLWREPRIEVEATSDGYVVRETDLES